MMICDLVFKCGLASSKSEARRLIQGGAITFKNEKVAKFDMQVTAAVANDALIKKGKKKFHRVVVK